MATLHDIKSRSSADDIFLANRGLLYSARAGEAHIYTSMKSTVSVGYLRVSYIPENGLGERLGNSIATDCNLIMIGAGVLAWVVLSEPSEIPRAPFIPIRCMKDLKPGEVCIADDFDGKGSRMTLARSDFEAYGGSVGLIAANMLLRVNGAPANAVFMPNPEGPDALGQVVWVSGGVNFLLNIEDRLDKSGKPTKWPIAQVLSLAEGIDSRCHWDRPKLPSASSRDRDPPPGFSNQSDHLSPFK